MFTVYALWNKQDDSIYVGQTINIERRLRQHREKQKMKCYTAKIDCEWQLIYSEEKDSRREALIRERQLKSHRGREFIRRYIPQS